MLLNSSVNCNRTCSSSLLFPVPPPSTVIGATRRGGNFARLKTVYQETMSVEAGRLIIRLLRGESILQMPVRETSLVPTVNWNGLRRWKISEANLPRGTVIVYKVESVWTQYWWQIFGIISLCIFE